jgi:predicted alpha/beta hydrolase
VRVSRPRGIHREVFRGGARRAQRGFAVAILDWRGQGLSDRALPNARKGHIYDFSEYDRISKPS